MVVRSRRVSRRSHEELVLWLLQSTAPQGRNRQEWVLADSSAC